MIYVKIFMIVFWLFFLIYDIIHKAHFANIVNDAVWLLDIVYLFVLVTKIASFPVLCIIDFIFVILWAIDFHIQIKYETELWHWMSAIMSLLFFMSFVFRILTIMRG